MTSYSFTFPAAAAPFGATVYNALGQVVDRLPLTVSGSNAVGSIDLPTGAYHARVEGFDGDAAGLVPDDTAVSAGGITGPAAWFTMAGTIADSTPAVKTPVSFTVIDDGRAPATGLVTVADGDATTLVAQEAGEFLIFCTVGAASDRAAATAGLAYMQANVAINGDNEAPAYYFGNGNLFWVNDGIDQIPQPTSFTFHQTLQVGDTIQVKALIAAQSAVPGASTQWLIQAGAIGITHLSTN